LGFLVIVEVMSVL